MKDGTSKDVPLFGIQRMAKKKGEAMFINKYHGNYNVQRRMQRVEYIVVHYTGSGTSKAGSALANCKYFSGGNRQSSAHYFIDDSGVWEFADPKEYFTWHCGDGHGKYGITNANSIGIEVCMDGDRPFTAAEIRYLTELVLYLMNKFSVSANKVVRHYDASGKMCPYYYAKRTPEWTKLRSVITGKYVNQWLKDDKGWKYYDGSGTAVKSKWIKWRGEWYYLKPTGYMAANEWAKGSKGWCYLGSDGMMATSKWIKWKDEWYYLKDDGYMAESRWIKYKNAWYWLKESGKMATAEWVKYKNEWYYLKADGKMATGTLKIGDKTYEFEPSGKWKG